MKKVNYHTSSDKNNYVDMIPPSPETWEWVKSNGDDVHIFEDSFLPEHVKYDGKVKVACLLEAPAIYDYCVGNNPSTFHPYEWIKNNHQHFQVVMSPFTFLRDIVGDRYWWVPVGGSRIKPENFGTYEKERLLSIVASHKQWIAGHKLRHQIVQKYPGKIDTYGSGFNDIVDDYEGTKLGKIVAIAPYHFSFAIMNSKIDDYFTEIILDVMAVGTVPLWWGTNNIGKYFNDKGIIKFDTIEELDAILPTLTPELYKSMLPAVLENIELSKNYRTQFDWIYTNYKDKLEAL